MTQGFRILKNSRIQISPTFLCWGFYLALCTAKIWARGTSAIILDLFILLTLGVVLLKQKTKSKNSIDRAIVQRLHNSRMKALRDMAGRVAHEVNNPLAILQSKTSQMRNRINDGNFDPERTLNDLSKIQHMISRLTKLIENLRFVSRDASSDPVLKASASEIVTTSLNLCQTQIKNRAIDLRIAPIAECIVECRAAQIYQALLSLLANSIEAVDPLVEKWITVEVQFNNSRVQFIVMDSGRGIDPKIAERIMEPLFTTKEYTQGQGLGLSVAKGIAEDHHGTLYYDRNSANTRFVLELPLKQPATEGRGSDVSYLKAS